MTPSGLKTTLTPRGVATTGRADEAAASKTTVASTRVRATTGARPRSSRFRWSSSDDGQADLLTL